MNQINQFFRTYRWCVALAFAGGCAVATIAYNVMGRAVGFENLSVTSLIPGFCIGSVSAFVISFLVIRNRNQLLVRLAAEQKIAADLKLEIVQRKLAEAELRAAKQDAELANRSKSEFLANVSHELRTPLNAIIGFSDTVCNEALGPLGNARYLEYMHDISPAGNHLLHLINDILDLSKIETGKSVLREEVVRLSYVIDSCTRIVKHRAEVKGIALNVDLEAVPRTLFADEQKLKQILINLITNGVKFTPAGGEVSIRCRQDRAGYVFEVADTGIGIAPQEVEKALSSFEQLDGALNRKFGGNGLGLSLSKSLTELHGGTLSLCSEVGVGTTVSVCFPLERIVDETSAASCG